MWAGDDTTIWDRLDPEGGAAPIVVELLGIVEVAGADLVGTNLPLLLQSLEAFEEDLHGRLAVIDGALQQVNVVGL